MAPSPEGQRQDVANGMEIRHKSGERRYGGGQGGHLITSSGPLVKWKVRGHRGGPDRQGVGSEEESLRRLTLQPTSVSPSDLEAAASMR